MKSHFLLVDGVAANIVVTKTEDDDFEVPDEIVVSEKEAKGLIQLDDPPTSLISLVQTKIKNEFPQPQYYLSYIGNEMYLVSRLVVKSSEDIARLYSSDDIRFRKWVESDLNDIMPMKPFTPKKDNNELH